MIIYLVAWWTNPWDLELGEELTTAFKTLDGAKKYFYNQVDSEFDWEKLDNTYFTN